MVLGALTGGLDLTKFTNAELYYLISGSLCDGDPGYTPERLYVSFNQSLLDSVPEIKFLFITVTMFEGTGQEGNRECTKVYLGKIDSEFDDIEICCAECSSEQLDPKENLDFHFVREHLTKNCGPVKLRPKTLLEALNRILSQQAFQERLSNDLFSFKHNSPVTPQIRSWFEFGSLPFSDTNFSGQYFLIAQPHYDHDKSVINSFKIFDNEDDLIYQHHIQYRIEVIKSVVDADSIQDYEHGHSDLIDRKEASVEITESPEHHKEGILLVLTETIMSLLVELTPATREALLGNGTLEEFVQQCNKKYSREFDLNFPDLGIAGAHEIAWQEVFSDFDDQVWK